MKKRFLILLLLCALLSGCRRRVLPDASEAIRQTYVQEVPDPALPGASGTVQGGEPDPNADPDRQWTPTAPPVEETVSAQGGETTPQVSQPPEEGEALTVTLDPNGGVCGQETLTVHTGAAYGSLPLAERAGYSFKGWFTQPVGGEAVDSTTLVTRRDDHTLYAQWSAQAGFLLTFDPNGGRISPYARERTAFPGDPYGELPTPTYRGYTFLGWFTGEGEEVRPEDTFDAHADLTLYAHWEYDPMAYWAFVLENTTQRIFTCQETAIYLELEGRGQTSRDAALIARTGSQNIAQNREDPQVTDEWVRERRPNVVVKLTGDLSTAHALEGELSARFPGCRIYVLPLAATEGSEAEQLYYQLFLAKALYPDWYLDLDLSAVAADLGIAPDI